MALERAVQDKVSERQTNIRLSSRFLIVLFRFFQNAIRNKNMQLGNGSKRWQEKNFQPMIMVKRYTMEFFFASKTIR